MSDYEVTLVNDNMQEFYVRYGSPGRSSPGCGNRSDRCLSAVFQVPWSERQCVFVIAGNLIPWGAIRDAFNGPLRSPSRGRQRRFLEASGRYVYLRNTELFS